MELGDKAKHREVTIASDDYVLRGPVKSYMPIFDSENGALRLDSIVFWEGTL